ncbi:hypothetical protein GGR19_000326 [Croceicoccus naphthovorans]|nr:hypothetical protein [Croceicoccus naphthovorans]
MAFRLCPKPGKIVQCQRCYDNEDETHVLCQQPIRSRLMSDTAFRAP